MNKVVDFSEMEFDLAIGRRIKFYRVALSMSQKDVAKMLEISYQQYQKYESGKNKISISKLVKLCAIIKVSSDKFLAGVLDSFSRNDFNEKLTVDPFYNLESLKLLAIYYKYPSETREKISSFLEEIRK